MCPHPEQRILDAASTLFYRDGIHATGIDTIVAESQVAKMTLYKYFKSKEELVIAFLKRRDKNWRQWFQATVERLGKTPNDSLLAIFDALEEWFQSSDYRGCAFINATAEYSDQAHPIHQTAAEHKQLVREYVFNLANAAEVSNPEELTDYLCLLMEGAIITALVKGDINAAKQARQAASILISSYSDNQL